MATLKIHNFHTNQISSNFICFTVDKDEQPNIIFKILDIKMLSQDLKKYMRQKQHTTIFKSTLNCDYNNTYQESIFS